MEASLVSRKVEQKKGADLLPLPLEVRRAECAEMAEILCVLLDFHLRRTKVLGKPELRSGYIILKNRRINRDPSPSP